LSLPLEKGEETGREKLELAKGVQGSKERIAALRRCKRVVREGTCNKDRSFDLPGEKGGKRANLRRIKVVAVRSQQIRHKLKFLRKCVKAAKGEEKSKRKERRGVFAAWGKTQTALVRKVVGVSP